ncbi:MAG: cache domain-containing protein [Spirochaetaceae bacterium]|nr:cache domain-containing protein [Spirochaetaceae bacterium]MDT8297714.1 cache domain-containing protein [Spirochaetaceae bacterium]
MTIREHADRTEELIGHRAEEIHRWIDRYFDNEGFADFLRNGYKNGYNPYSHRKHRHCRESLPEVREEFRGLYSQDVIDAVFERHIRDDYDGYFPYREDFENGTFREKYHEDDTRKEHAGINPDDLAAYFKGKHYERIAASTKRRGIRFLWRFLLPVFTALILLVGSLFAVIVPVSRENMMNLKKDMIRELTAVAVGALEYYADLTDEGSMTELEARQNAAEEIRRMRYGTDSKEYYWIIDSEPRMVMHPYRPELEGEDLSNYRDREDTDGVYLFREAANIALETGDGYLSYWWQHWDDPGAVAPKLSYVRYFPEWDWIVGTGVYIDDVDLEMRRLAISLEVVFGGIALVSIALLAWVLAGALRVQRRRDAAEEGLREAKERYRALAEASTEGYMLITGGTPVFANPAMSRMTGRSEEDLLSMGPSDLLDSGMAKDHPARCALAALKRGEAPSGTWTVSILLPGGGQTELQLSLSRIFLPGSNGHVISLRRPVTAGERITASESTGISSIPAIPTSEQLNIDDNSMTRIRKAKDRLTVIDAVGEMGEELNRLIDGGSPASALRMAVAEHYEAAIARFADLAADKIGSRQPLEWTLMSLGSNARREMTPFSDQDGAMIFTPRKGEDLEGSRKICLELAASVTDGLEASGFPRCEGGVMPINPRWCLSLEEWNTRIGEWISSPSAQAMLEINVALDRRHAWGDGELFLRLDKLLSELSRRNPALLILYAESVMRYRPPRIRGSRGTVDIKEALKPLEGQLRLLALRHGISAASTMDRLAGLRSGGVIDESRFSDLGAAFETLWTLRFNHQLRGPRRPVKPDDVISLGDLSKLQRTNLKACLELIEDFIRRNAMEMT